VLSAKVQGSELILLIFYLITITWQGLSLLDTGAQCPTTMQVAVYQKEYCVCDTKTSNKTQSQNHKLHAMSADYSEQ